MHGKTLLDLELGGIPRVVGTVSSYETLPAGPSRPTWPCDLVEVRLDLFEARPDDWLTRCAAIQAPGRPVFLTVRSALEGGRWNGRENERERLFASALNVLATIDVEWSSPIKETLCAQAATLRKPVIVSHHNFAETPPLARLIEVVDAIVALGDTIPKVATFVNRPEDIAALQELLARYAPRLPICVIGMGPLGKDTRLTFPLAGSALTYGYLDRATAPGQMSAAELSAKLGARAIVNHRSC